MTVIRAIIAALGAVLTALIVRAVQTGDFWAAGRWLTNDIWGIVTLTDLYLGLFLSALAMGLLEKGMKAAFWIVPLPFLGNVWTAIWVLIRLPELARRLRG
ncbi:MAG: hypothetical protein WCC66_10095 [Rhizobiaceae bacterium]